MEEERISIEELEKLLKELEEKEKQKKELIIPVAPQMPQLTVVSTAVVSEEKQHSFTELAKQFEELANRLELVEKAMTKGICYHVKLPFSKDEEYATVCRYNFADIYQQYPLDEQTAKLLIDLLFKYYKHAAMSLQALDELEECDNYPPIYHVVMFADPIRLAVLYPGEVALTYVFKLQDGEYPEIIRILINIGDRPRLRSICRVTNVHDVEAIKVNLLESLDMPLNGEEK
jgi:hypothetical protein